MEGADNGALRDAAPLLQKFFEDAATLPDWLDLEAFTSGVRMFHKNTRLVLAGMAGGVLVEGFTTNIAKSFFITGRCAIRASGACSRTTATWWRYHAGRPREVRGRLDAVRSHPG